MHQTISLSRLPFPLVAFMLCDSNLVPCLTDATDAILCLDHITLYNILHKIINATPPKNGYAIIRNAFDPV